ncbi:MAG: S9 family peptidase [Sphingomonadales bacterium]|nr:S9 family peptidase [Sphingomonadales bacterium]
MRIVRALAIVGLFASPVFAQSLPERPLPNYPHTRASELVEDHFGEMVADPFRWLENDVRTNQEVRDWVNRENALSSGYLSALPGRTILAERMKQIIGFERYGTPRKAGRFYFYLRNDGLQNQSVLYVREGLDGRPRSLVDPNGWARDGATALAEWMPSNDGHHVAFAVQDGGTDWRTLRVIDVDTGDPTMDEIKWVKFSSLAWKADGSGFFYSRFPEPEAGGTFQSINLNQAVYFHALGTSQAHDVKIYATPERPSLRHSAQVTDDGQYLLITSADGTDQRYELTVAKIDKGEMKLRSLVKGLDHNWSLAGSVGTRFFFLTNNGAPRGRLVTLDVARRYKGPVEIVGQTADTLVGASLVGERMILAYLGDAKSEAELRTLDGRLIGPITLPAIGSAAGFGGKGGDPETFYTFSSYAIPPTVYRFDTNTGKAEIFTRPKVAFDPADYVTEQRFYSSKDGTRIPMFLVQRKDSLGKGPMPTLLYGYGGFNISVAPAFDAPKLAWLEQGGALAVANLRGGGEYGANWHNAGRLQAKQNVFDDFIAAGEYLIAEGLTSKDKLAIEGRSNGGLLVGAVVNQRPDLFAAALPAVGVMDMLRFNQFTSGRFWIDDYGDPAKEADFRVLRSYSPYHNVAGGREYPAILVTTADTDDRVVPGHSFKYVAALQSADIGNKPHLIRIETRAGHGSGKPTDKIIAESADMYAFIAKWTGLSIKSP